MLVAFRRSAVSHALRSSPRTLSARPTQRLQSLYSSITGPSYAPKSLFHSSPFRFSSSAISVEKDATEKFDLDQPGQSTSFRKLAEDGTVSRPLIDCITSHLRLENMTEVQRLTIPESVNGGDLLAQAKTGTGKTLAFLVPVLERLAKDRSLNKSIIRRGRKVGTIDIRSIIISPTRELAEQIADQAAPLASRLGLIVQKAVGGTQKRDALRRVYAEGCHILVATPGRLRDLLSNHVSGVTAPKLSSLVLDEADRLLDQGFAPELMEIQNLLPDPKEVDRQTLMFSATVAPEVVGMVRNTMKPDFKFVKTVNDNEIPTHLSVPQKTVVLNGLENAMPALLELVKLNLDRVPPFKAIVYFNSTKHTSTAYEIFRHLLIDPETPRSGNPLDPLFRGEIHSRLSQAERTRVSNKFRRCKSGILFSSDVTSRGMDFPGVTHVIQIGTPRDRDTYIHRLGRTARAGRTGEGWIFLHPGEKGAFDRLMRDIPVHVDNTTLTTAGLNMLDEAEVTPEALSTLMQVKSATAQLLPEAKEETISAILATLSGIFKNKRMLSTAIQDLSVHGFGLRSTPSMSEYRSQILGLDQEDGFVVRTHRRTKPHGGRDRRDSFGGRRESFGGRRESFGGRRESFGGRRDSFGGGRDRGSGRGRGERRERENVGEWLHQRRDEWA